MISSNLSSQNLHIVRANNIIYELMPSGALVERVSVDIISNSPLIIDIAITPSNKLYAMTSSDGIIEINWENGEYEVISDELYFSSKSLVAASDNELYFMKESKRLYRYEIDKDSSVFIAYLDYKTPGDICFYKGNIIYPTLNNIRAYDLESNIESTIYCFPDIRVYYGIALVDSDCDSTKVYVPNHYAFANPTFQVLNLETGMETTLATNNSTSIDIYGMANQFESEALDCPTHKFEDLNCDDIVSTESFANNLATFSIFPNPTESTLHFKGLENFDLIKIYNNQGILIASYNENIENIDVEYFSAGMYYLEVYTQDKKAIRKFIKN